MTLGLAIRGPSCGMLYLADEYPTHLIFSTGSGFELVEFEVIRCHP
jgi:hypothetical protein